MFKLIGLYKTIFKSNSHIAGSVITKTQSDWTYQSYPKAFYLEGMTVLVILPLALV